MRPAFTLALIFSILGLPLIAQSTLPPYVGVKDDPLYTEFFDSGFPFMETTIDLREKEDPSTQFNVAPRAVLIPLNENCFVAFDTELLRVAAVWQGDYPTKVGLASYSYEKPSNKMGGGFDELPQPQGNWWAHTDAYPGWQNPSALSRKDPRTLFTDPKALGKGPLQGSQWIGIEDAGKEAILRYSLNGAHIAERFSTSNESGQWVIQRHIKIENLSSPLALIAEENGEELNHFLIKPSRKATHLRVDYHATTPAKLNKVSKPAAYPKKETPHWPSKAESGLDLGEIKAGYAADEFRIPYPNPWKRRIRPTSIDFLSDGTAVVVTFDGDVYRIENLNTTEGSTKWKRIAAGFNEPQGIRVRNDEIFVFSRLGIIQLIDKDGDHEIDHYKMFSNGFVQSPDSRDFTASLILRNDGSFFIAKGGQQNGALNPHSGRVLNISEDGQEITVFAEGFRNAYLGYDTKTDTLTSSDQQGHYVPTTPFYKVEEGKFYGHELSRPNPEKIIENASMWIPHRVAQSGIGQVMGFDKRAGSLKGNALYLNYHRGTALRIQIPETKQAQTSGLPLPVTFGTPLLQGAINPIDGLAYVVGFQIWGTVAERLEGIGRLRVLEENDGLPAQADVSLNGITLTFAETLEPAKAIDPANYDVSAWNYRRTSSYGSPQYRGDSTPGSDSITVHSVFISEDQKSVFLAIPEMPHAMQLEVQVKQGDDWNAIYTTSNALAKEKLVANGFESIDFAHLFQQPITPRETASKSAIVSAAQGQLLYNQLGCVSCHSVDGSKEGKVGPTWKGLYRDKRKLNDGTTVRATAEYLRESIYEPEAKKPVGYDGPEAGMPSYLGILSEEQVESIILFIETL